MTIHERDIAAVSALALVDAAHTARTYVLTGPQALTQREKARLIGEAISREVSWVEVALSQLRQALLAQGVPEDVPDRIIGYWAGHVGRQEPSSPALERLLGRPALTFAQWATEHYATFRN